MSTNLLQATCDQFLGGQVKAYQPEKGFRSGSDAVLLAAAVKAQNGEKCLEFGCGVGVASLCLAKRLAGEGITPAITGIDIQSKLIDLAQKNADMNGMTQNRNFFFKILRLSFLIGSISSHRVFIMSLLTRPILRKIKVLRRQIRARHWRMLATKLTWIYGSTCSHLPYRRWTVDVNLQI